MAASNKRKAAASPAPKPRRFGDKIALHHCNDEKKLSRKRASRTIAEGKAKFLGRKRKVSSPGQKENQCAVALITKNAVNPFVCGDEQSATESSVSFGDKELQLPEVRMVGHLTALRCQPRLTDERVDIEIYVKRHEKLEKEEKQILRRDRIWQNEIRRRSRLLRIQQTPPRFRDFRIVVLRKLTRNFK
ncbi:hypothetical protein GCK32_016938 [Trichostrongylus colubriformis]|uniref:Uncharacterized protein n=1 Tax=Trichostrongylus colubriformis TaxID=6319 RepID=A0AAN8G2X0_TRICO